MSLTLVAGSVVVLFGVGYAGYSRHLARWFGLTEAIPSWVARVSRSSDSVEDFLGGINDDALLFFKEGVV